MKKQALLAVALVLVASTAAVAGQHEVGGKSTAFSSYPFHPAQPGMRWQTIWHKSDINEGGAITKVEFQAYRIILAAYFTGCKVLLCHTTRDHVAPSFSLNYSGKTPVTIFSGYKVVAPRPLRDWFAIAEPTNFTYNNSDNLLIEVSWTRAEPWTTTCVCFTNSSGKAGRVYAFNPKAATGTVTNNYDQIGRITIGSSGVEATSLGRVKSIFK